MPRSAKSDMWNRLVEPSRVNFAKFDDRKVNIVYLLGMMCHLVWFRNWRGNYKRGIEKHTSLEKACLLYPYKVGLEVIESLNGSK